MEWFSSGWWWFWALPRAGKSALAIRLAEKLGGEIMVCDSTQVYRHFDIGTAKVPPAEQRGIPHHLVDLVEPDEVFTAGEYRRRAHRSGFGRPARHRRGKLPILDRGNRALSSRRSSKDFPMRRSARKSCVSACAPVANGVERLISIASFWPGWIPRRGVPDHAPARHAKNYSRAWKCACSRAKPLDEIHGAGRRAP